MNNNTVVQTLWISPVLGEHQRYCLQSFLDQGHEVHLYSYNRIQNIPNGIKMMDANSILDSSLIFKDLYHSYATFSDWFRIKLLYNMGGWWVDSDMVCIKPFIVDWPYVFATEIEKHEDKDIIHICNCVIKMPKGSEMALSILNRINECLASKASVDIKWTEIGAKYMKNEIIDRNLDEYIVSPEVFCPFDYGSFQKIFTSGQSILDDSTYGIHLWNKMWEWSEKDPLSIMTKDSFFFRLIKKN